MREIVTDQDVPARNDPKTFIGKINTGGGDTVVGHKLIIQGSNLETLSKIIPELTETLSPESPLLKKLLWVFDEISESQRQLLEIKELHNRLNDLLNDLQPFIESVRNSKHTRFKRKLETVKHYFRPQKQTIPGFHKKYRSPTILNNEWTKVEYQIEKLLKLSSTSTKAINGEDPQFTISKATGEVQGPPWAIDIYTPCKRIRAQLAETEIVLDDLREVSGILLTSVGEHLYKVDKQLHEKVNEINIYISVILKTVRS